MDEAIELEKLLIKIVRLNHPGGAIGSVVKDKETGMSFGYLVDTTHISGEIDSNLVEHIRGCAFILYDATYADRKIDPSVITYDEHSTYGHSTLGHGVKIAEAAEVNRLIGFHHCHEQIA